MTITEAREGWLEEQDSLLDRLLTGKKPARVSPMIEFSGNQIVLPKNMSLDGAINFLAAKRDEKAGLQLKRMFDYKPWDGAAATTRVLDRDYGGFATHSDRDPWTGERIAATRISIPTSLTDSVTISWGGNLVIAALPDCIVKMHTGHSEKGTVFAIDVMAPPEMEADVEGLFDAVQRELAENSIYRGKSFDAAEMPNFLDLDTVDPTRVVYSEEVLTQLEANVWSMLRYPDEMRRLGLQMKRSVLFEGPYGTGKTLAAYLTAREANANGWAFIYCRPGEDEIEDALQTARLYEPCVVFFEDLDAIIDNGDKDITTRLLDAFDGIQNKGTQILAVLTTNHVDQLHKGLLRPGRLDAVVSIGALDRPGLKKLVQMTIPAEHLSEAIDYDRLYMETEGMMPAFVREALERAIRYAITRNAGTFSTLTTDDIIHAVVGMRPQLDLMDAAQDERMLPSVDEVVGDLVGEKVTDLMREWIVPLYDEAYVEHENRPKGWKR